MFSQADFNGRQRDRLAKRSNLRFYGRRRLRLLRRGDRSQLVLWRGSVMSDVVLIRDLTKDILDLRLAASRLQETVGKMTNGAQSPCSQCLCGRIYGGKHSTQEAPRTRRSHSESFFRLQTAFPKGY